MPPDIFNIDFFGNIGVRLDKFGAKISGNLYEYPEDFAVNEVHENGICSIMKFDKTPSYDKEYVHCTLVKKNISTFEACDIITRENNIDTSAISFCGLKDTLGITSQLICIKNSPDMKLYVTDFNNFFITNIVDSDKKINVGDHLGNNFIIRMRNISTPRTQAEKIIKDFILTAEKGLPNFYGLQRFGVRQDNHLLGKMLIKKNYGDFLVRFLTYSANETDEIHHIREKISQNFGDWDSCLKIIGDSVDLVDERLLITNIKNCDDKQQAIKKLKLSNFFVHSYSSYLFNMALSKFLEKNTQTCK